MRPRKLRYVEAEQALVLIYDLVRNELKKRKNCNQFYIARHLKTLFDFDSDWTEFNQRRVGFFSHERATFNTPAFIKQKSMRDARYQELATRFGIPENFVRHISHYIRTSSPAAIVQMVKRIKQVQN